MHAGWLTFAMSQLLIEFEATRDNFDLRHFILVRSGIDIDRPFLFFHDKHGVYYWYQNPTEGVN